MRQLSMAAVLCGIMLLPPLATARAQATHFEHLTRRIPSKANTIILVNINNAMASPLATTEKWEEKLEREFAAGLTTLPPTANLFVMSAELDFEYMKPLWELSLADLKQEPQLAKLAATLGGEMDNISGEPAAMLPGDHCVVQFGPRIAALMTPANRQNIGRWINGVNADSLAPLTDYLQQAIGYADSGSPIIMALDLQHIASASKIRARLEQSPLMKDREKDLDAFSEALASIKGVMLGITLDKQRFGKIKVDFGKDVSALDTIAKPLLLQVLADRGAMIDEFQNWTAKAEGTQITLEGYLYQSGMRRILSLLDTPSSLQPPAQHAADPAATEESLMAMATQQYYKDVVQLLDDLGSKRKSDEFVTWGQVGMWFDKYARKIERMPIVNVDPVMLNWGGWVTSQLRDAEYAMKGIGAKSKMRQTELGNFTSTYGNVYAAGVTRWGAAGYYTYGNVETRNDLRLKGQAEANIRTQESIRGNSSANLIMQGIDHSMQDIRRQMTEKYKINF